MKAAIIGAGIGGLTTAIALQQAGIDFEIFEAALELRPVGAGIVMASNAMQVFRRLKIEKKIQAVGFEIESAFGVDQSFKLISGLRVKEKIASHYGIGSYALHRGRLQQTLLSALPPTAIRLGKKLVTLTQAGEKVVLKFADSTTAQFDLVIGADGIKSAVRKNLFGEVPFRYSGQTCWRGMTAFTLPESMQGNTYEMWGKQKGLRFGFVPTAKNEIYYFTTLFAPANGKDDPGDVKASLIKHFSRFGDIPTRLIESTTTENIIRSDIYDFQPMQKWWSGRVALLGDAAHATTPNLGQGGCQAVEDAFVIAKCIRENVSIEKALDQYQNIRYEKASLVTNLSWRLGGLTNLGNPMLQSLRNAFMRMLPESMAIKQLDKILSLNY